jgi:hypothetical protein
VLQNIFKDRSFNFQREGFYGFLPVHFIQVCVHPKLNPFAGEYAKHFHSVEPLKCSEEEDWLSLSNGTIYIDPGIKKKQSSLFLFAFCN